MSAYTTTFTLNAEQEERVLDYYRACLAYSNNRHDMRSALERIDRLYMRELDNTIEQWKAKNANRQGDPTKFQNIVVPVVMPQVESAVAYQNSVFLQGHPIFASVASPEYSDIALQMDSIIEDQQTRGGWVNELQKAFRCGFKYNISAVLVDWHQEVAYVEAGDKEDTEVIWEGNRVKTLDLYNTFFDPSPTPSRVHAEGEYAGYTEQRSRMGLYRIMRDLPGVFNQAKALQAANKTTASTAYYLPLLHADVLIQPDSLISNHWAGLGMPKGATSDLDSKELRNRITGNAYSITNFYAWIMPDDFGIDSGGSNGTPQIWKFVIVNGSVIIQAERQTNAHGYLPVIVTPAYDDMLGFQTKSLALNVGPIQEITSAVANSIIAGKRRAVGDRLLYDPARISPSDINNDSPTSRIPVKPSAFNSEINSAIYPLPFADDTLQDSRQDVNLFLGMADSITGMNPARQGQFVKGNKTREEFSQIMANSNGRDHTIAMSYESTLFTPMKTIVKANILQFQQPATLFSTEDERAIEVDPAALKEAMTVFKLADGLVPTEKMLDTDILTVAFQTIQSVPEITARYDGAGLFTYLMKSKGAKLRPFEKSQERVAYEQAAQQWQQTMMMVAEQLKERLAEMSEEEIQELMEGLPPQPKPEDFGWNPSQQYKPEPEGSLLEQFIGAIQETREQMEVPQEMPAEG